MRSRARQVESLFGRHLRALRQDRHLSQEALAEKANLNVNVVGRLERAVIAPGLVTILKLSVALEVTVGELLLPFDSETIKRIRLVHGRLGPVRRSTRGRKI